jgi:general secretion pathway protein G
MHNQNHPRQQGFTLVEIMVVIVIIGLLATLVAPAVLGLGEDAKVEKARADVKTISDTIKIYLLKGGSRQSLTMETLTTPDDKGKVWLDNISKDPWGHDYVIRESDSPNKFEVLSAGPNGSEGDDDDISSTKMASGK